jgi:hypothetical protein
MLERRIKIRNEEQERKKRTEKLNFSDWQTIYEMCRKGTIIRKSKTV